MQLVSQMQKKSLVPDLFRLQPYRAEPFLYLHVSHWQIILAGTLSLPPTGPHTCPTLLPCHFPVKLNCHHIMKLYREMERTLHTHENLCILVLGKWICLHDIVEFINVACQNNTMAINFFLKKNNFQKTSQIWNTTFTHRLRQIPLL